MITDEQMKRESEFLQKAREDSRIEFIKENTAKWQAEGAEHKAKRIACVMTLADLSRMTGFSSSKLRNFENGEPVNHRRAVEQSYKMACLIRYYRTKEATSNGLV